MTRLDRRHLGPAALYGLPVALLLCTAAWAVLRGSDEVPAEAPQDLGPDIRVAAVHRRLVTKMRLAHQVMDGRLTLTEATAHFRDLDEQPPALDPDTLRLAYPGRSDEERHRLEVVRFVRVELSYALGLTLSDEAVEEWLRLAGQRQGAD